MSRISAVVITYNEERNIERCLKSLQNISDEIIVIDSFSTDRTEEICKSFNVNFYKRQWDDFSSAKNAGNEKAVHYWILSLDADEALSDELKKSILEIKNTNAAGNYKFNRLTNYCGKWIHHCGWYPDTKTRLFLRTQCHWEGTVHEQLVIKSNAPVHFLKGDLLHYSYVTTDEFISKQNKYAETSAAQLYRRGTKANFFHVYMKPPIKFFRDYIFHLGLLDGKEGYTISRISAKALYRKYKRLSELQRSH
ncbi:MAG TPA: glycosyltransferase family 2 protein [Bacteroidia bacterium]|nr:glycosyltransferase family 2 protein [Bacteroidia bacterium]